MKYPENEIKHILKDRKVDSRISRIDKIFAKYCPKFLDLYASIYGK